MSNEKLIKAIGERFGQNALKFHNANHAHVFENGRRHNLWFTKTGLKWQLDGQIHARQGPAENFLRAIDAMPRTETDLGKMKSALEMCEMVGRFAESLANIDAKRAVFCDAGFKDGRARIGVLLVNGNDMHAVRRAVDCANISEAEREAVVIGLTLADQIDPTITVYTDSKTTAESFKSSRVAWIPRQQNKMADGLANLRGRK